jgi:hypothetical protein
MKKIFLIIAIILVIAINVNAGCPNSEPMCLDINGDITVNGTITSAGSAERVQGTDSYVDFDDPTATGSIRLGAFGLTNNEYFDIDFETTADNISFSSSNAEYIFNRTVDAASTDSTPNGLYIVSALNDTTDVGQFAGLNTETVWSTATRSGTFNVMGFQVNNKIGGDGTVGSIYGLDLTNYWDAEAGQELTVSEIIGIQNRLRLNTTGADDETITLTDLKMYLGRIHDQNGEINTTTAYHFDLQDLNTGGVTSTTAYGFYLRDQTSTNVYGTMLVDGADCHWMDGTGGTAVCSETVTISTAQIKALAGTPITLVSARSGAWLEPVSVVLMYDYDTAAFDDAAADGNIIIEYSGGTDLAAAIEADGFIDAAADIGRYLGGATNFTYPAITDDIMDVDGEAIRITNDGAEYTGTGGGELDVKITYYVHALGL